MSAKDLIKSDDTTIGEIQEKIKKLERDTKVLIKLYFLLDILHDVPVIIASEKIGITPQTGYNWIKQWNENKFDNLERKKGSKGQSKLKEWQFLLVDLEIEKRGLNTSKEVRALIKELFHVDYSIRQIERIMKKLGYSYTKPYQIYTKMPENAKEDLKKRSSPKFS